jgi:hypothetical protein
VRATEDSTVQKRRPSIAPDRCCTEGSIRKRGVDTRMKHPWRLDNAAPLKSRYIERLGVMPLVRPAAQRARRATVRATSANR